MYPFATNLLLGGLFSSTPPNCPWGIIIPEVDFEYFTGPVDTTCLFSGLSVQGAVEPDLLSPNYAIAFSKTSANVTVQTSLPILCLNLLHASPPSTCPRLPGQHHRLAELSGGDGAGQRQLYHPC